MDNNNTMARQQSSNKVMTTLDERYKDDPQLLAFYKTKLLEPGWAGELDRVEFAYVRSELQKSPTLRRRWGFRPSAKRLSEKRIREVARNGLQKRLRHEF